MFVYDETSPTFLRWIIPRKGRSGKPVARKNNGQAGNLTPTGVSVNISGDVYSSKYIVWILVNGTLPEGRDVLFVDGNAQNLKASNLRLNQIIPEGDKYGEYLKDYFEYDETSPSCLRWKSKYARGSRIGIGDVTGSLDDMDGYWRIHALGTHLKAHKVVWSLFNSGSQEGFTIDHINGVRGDNRIINLRLVENEINQRNRSMNKNNKTGTNGISFSGRFQDNGDYYSKYSARAIRNGKPVSRTFSVQKYGDEKAFRLAVEWRDGVIEELNTQGAGYTERHGT